MQQTLFEFRCLGSGSSGNAYLFHTDEGFFLIDAGVAIRRLKKSLNDTGVTPSRLSAIFMTHDHSDHARNVGTLQQAAAKAGHSLTLYATADAYESVCKNPTITHKPLPAHTVFLHKGQTETCCGCEITPFHVPHDSDDNVGYFLSYGPHSLCLITDAGNITGEMEHYVAATDQLIIEANYDEGMLAAGFYPAFLKQRISGNRGHLGNTDAAELIYRHRHHLKQVWLCHLSENNNTPQHALDSIDTCFQTRGNCHPADYLKLSALPRTTASDVFRLA